MLVTARIVTSRLHCFVWGLSWKKADVYYYSPTSRIVLINLLATVRSRGWCNQNLQIHFRFVSSRQLQRDPDRREKRRLETRWLQKVENIFDGDRNIRLDQIWTRQVYKWWKIVHSPNGADFEGHLNTGLLSTVFWPIEWLKTSKILTENFQIGKRSKKQLYNTFYF